MNKEISVISLLCLAILGNLIEKREGFTEMDEFDTGTNGVHHITSHPMPFYSGSLSQPNRNLDMKLQGHTGVAYRDSPVSGVQFQKKREIQPFHDIAPDGNRYVQGQPVYQAKNRYNVSHLQNNIAPVERMNVGPGLGVGPGVKATGGFHQKFRILPGNVGEYKLTSLPGRNNHASFFVPTSTSRDFKFSNNRPSKVFVREAGTGSRGQGQGGRASGAPARGIFLREKRQTHRSATNTRTDGLTFSTPTLINKPTNSSTPTDLRNDNNKTRTFLGKQPGVSTFVPGTQMAQNATRAKVTKRNTPNSYLAPGGISNVTQTSGGFTTRQRISRSTSAVGGKGGQGISQNYVNNSLTRQNPYKSNFFPQDFTTAKRVLAKNPFNNQ